MLQFYVNKQGDVQLATADISIDFERKPVCKSQSFKLYRS